MNLIPYTASMEYTHVDNIDGMAMTNAAYARKWPRFENFPTTTPGCATRAASMIKVGFVIHDPFDSCFKMGHGYDVMALLINDALSDDALRTAWNRCATILARLTMPLQTTAQGLASQFVPKGRCK
jgi:hypothetical protein